MNTLTFNGKNNWNDFKAYLNYFRPSYPIPTVISITVPYMNGSYDFSTLGSNGEQVFTDRKIDFSLEFIEYNKEKLLQTYNSMIAWLFSDGQLHDLIYSTEPNMKYRAKIIEISPYENLVTSGKIQGAFLAEPFKYGVDYEGNKVWDTFNFETDVIQEVGFDVVDNTTVNIINVARAVCPTINVNAPMSITYNGKVYNLSPGTNKIYALKLSTGDNSLTITGTGHIEILFIKEMI